MPWQRDRGRETVVKRPWWRDSSGETMLERPWQRDCGRETVAVTETTRRSYGDRSRGAVGERP